jgi:peptide/nickel transport system permease protein
MSFKDALAPLKEFWGEFRRSSSGLIGLGILGVSVLLVIFEPLIVPFPEVGKRWKDINYWEDNSSSAPPAWTNFFLKQKKTVSSRIENPRVSVEEGDGIIMDRIEFPYRWNYDLPPHDLIFKAVGTGTFQFAVSVERPDGETIELFQRVEQELTGQDVRVSFNTDVRNATFEYLRSKESTEAITELDSESVRPTEIIFSEAGQGMAKAQRPLKGEYKFIISTMRMGEESKIERPRLLVVGAVSGILGTDTGKRDIFSGLVSGLKWALLIGLMTSAISVLIGVMYGIVAAYYGGVVDTVMTFIFELFVSMPVLPILIVASAVFKPSIWFTIGALILFSWVGSVKTVRSMALQIKEETYIEAAKALGASNQRIIWRHMAPLLIPYSFASMALSVPGAIVYESSISLLGLGDATIVTWGQILFDANRGGAILNGVWWWIVPPGLLIAIMGMTFAFLGFAMDKILHPKLRTR